MVNLIKEKFNIIYLVYFLFLSVSFGLGMLTYLVFGDIAGSCNVLVITKSDLVELEKNRITQKDGSFNSKDMFFGNQRSFLDLVLIYGLKFTNNKTKLILINDNSGSLIGGENITSIVHEAVAEAMKHVQIQDK